MIAQHQTVFKEDLANKKIKVTREFDAPVDKVWRAWTEPALLDKWWAPKPWKAVTKSMDFREGGNWLYYMQGPEGEKHHCICEYKTIDPEKNFTGTDAFTDEDGNVNKEMPQMAWDVSFRDQGNSTLVEVIISFASEEAMKQTIEMGFKDGFAAAHSNLDELLS
jgi:uncharacterized protein YndB with AHSA1/START domain